MAKKTYYEFLGISSNATNDEIRTAIRNALLEAHTDKGGDPTKAARRIELIKEARDVLTFPQSRKNYDQNPIKIEVDEREAKQSPSDPSSLSIEDIKRAPSSAREYDAIVKVVLIGERYVGKTCLKNRFAEEDEDDSNQPLAQHNWNGRTPPLEGIQHSSKMFVTSNQAKVKIQTWDGKNLRDPVLRGAQAIVILVDTTDRDTLDNLEARMNEARDIGPRSKIYIVGTKSDLAKKRAFAAEEVNEKLNQLKPKFPNIVSYSECSAKEKTGVLELFYRIAEDFKPILTLQDREKSTATTTPVTSTAPRSTQSWFGFGQKTDTSSERKLIQNPRAVDYISALVSYVQQQIKRLGEEHPKAKQLMLMQMNLNEIDTVEQAQQKVSDIRKIVDTNPFKPTKGVQALDQIFNKDNSLKEDVTSMDAHIP